MRFKRTDQLNILDAVLALVESILFRGHGSSSRTVFAELFGYTVSIRLYESTLCFFLLVNFAAIIDRSCSNG